jgi:hypothetical protein
MRPSGFLFRLVSFAYFSSADFRQVVNSNSSLFSPLLSQARFRGIWRISQGKIQNVTHVNAGFIKHTQSADGGFRRHVPACPGCTTPRIRFLLIDPCFRIGLPPDPASRRRPCPSPSLRLRSYLAREDSHLARSVPCLAHTPCFTRRAGTSSCL